MKAVSMVVMVQSVFSGLPLALGPCFDTPEEKTVSYFK